MGTAITITNSGTGTQEFNIRSRVYTGGNSVATISAISGTQAVVAPAVSGAGQVSEVTVTTNGTNYRTAPVIVFDDPYYGIISTVSIQSQSATNYGTSQTYTGIIQKSIAGSSATGATFTVVTDGNGTIESVTVTAGGTAYVLGDQLTISGADLGGSDGTHDAVFAVPSGGLIFVDPVSTETLLNASIDSVTVTNSGSGYLSAPTITAQGGNGINAALNGTILNEGVSNIQIEAAGEQFQSAPIINIEQKVGTGASILLKSSDLGKILKIGGENITFNYSHDRTLKPKLNTTYNLQLVRTQIIDYLDVVNGGQNFVAVPDIVLVGDSLSMVSLGYKSTLPVTLQNMIDHTNSVCRGFHKGLDAQPLVVCDMPFLSYHCGEDMAVEHAGKIIKGTPAKAVKLEGAEPEIQAVISRLIRMGIPVMGHLGLTPQNYLNQGFKKQGESLLDQERIKKESLILEELGCFSLVLEHIPDLLAKEIKDNLIIPVIGIGAGNKVDGQVLVLHDMLGMNKEFSPRFLRRYLDLNQVLQKAISKYSKDVKSMDFPNNNEQY
mgnify:CR=1 FL=1